MTARLQRLRRITSPFILRRLKTTRASSPIFAGQDRGEGVLQFDEEQASLYEAVVKEAEAAINAASGIERKGLVLATL